jgi:hypothetical protein
MKHFRILNLPTDPLKDKNSLIEKYKISDPGYDIEDPAILTDEVLEIFKKLNLNAESVVVFKTYNYVDGSDNNRIIHSDICWDSESSNWLPIVFGINWELTDVKGTFKWWNVDSSKIVYPGNNSPVFPYTKLNGLHYEERVKPGIPNNSILIEETYSNSPMLVRTDIPHSVTYSGYGRMSISVRFSDQTLSWDEAVNILSPIII